MLDNLRHQLWQAKFLNPVTPQDLLQNANDPSYNSIDFKTGTSGMKVTLQFEDNGDLVKAVYHYDPEGLLQESYMVEPNGKSIIFDRQSIIKDLLVQIQLLKSSQSSSEVSA